MTLTVVYQSIIEAEQVQISIMLLLSWRILNLLKQGKRLESEKSILKQQQEEDS